MSSPRGPTREAWLGATLLAGAAFLAASLVVTPTRADCEPSSLGPIEVTPAAGARDVTLDAPVQARFTPGYFGDDGPHDDPETLLRVRECGACGGGCASATPVPGTIQVLGDDLFFLPAGDLAPNTQYQGSVSGRDGSIPFSFCTGSRYDYGPPSFSDEVRIGSEPVGPSCDLPDGGYRAGVFVQPASDDGPGGSIEYLLFLTRADGIDAPVLVDRVRNFASGEITLRLFIAPERTNSLACVRVAVIDGVGNVTMGAHEHCFDPISKLAFQGCSVGAGLRARTPPGVTLLALALVASLALRRRRPR